MKGKSHCKRKSFCLKKKKKGSEEIYQILFGTHWSAPPDTLQLIDFILGTNYKGNSKQKSTFYLIVLYIFAFFFFFFLFFRSGYIQCANVSTFIDYQVERLTGAPFPFLEVHPMWHWWLPTQSAMCECVVENCSVKQKRKRKQ